MAGELNIGEFTDPEKRLGHELAARGWDAGKREFRGGVQKLGETKLEKGHFFFRIGHTRGKGGHDVPRWVNFTSPWWMNDQTLLEIGIGSRDDPRDIRMLFRLTVALSPQFGTADTIFGIYVKAPMRAFVGAANPVEDDPDSAVAAGPFRWPGNCNVPQHYVPGLRAYDAAGKPTGPSAIWNEAFTMLKPVSVWEWEQLADPFGLRLSKDTLH